MQIKTTRRYHFTSVRMAAIQKSTNYKCWRDCREKGTLLHCWWECKPVQPLWRTVWRFLKTGNRTAIWPSNPTSGHTHQGNQTWKRHVYPDVYRSTVYNSQVMEAIKMSINQLMDKEVVVHTYHEILLGHKVLLLKNKTKFIIKSKQVKLKLRSWSKSVRSSFLEQKWPSHSNYICGRCREREGERTVSELRSHMWSLAWNWFFLFMNLKAPENKHML